MTISPYTSRLKIMLIFVVLTAAFVGASFMLARDTVLRGISENLAADSIVLGLTLALLDPWNKKKEREPFAFSELKALEEVQEVILEEVAALGFVLAFTFKNNVTKQFGITFAAVDFGGFDGTEEDRLVRRYLAAREKLEKHVNDKALTEEHAKHLLMASKRTRKSVREAIRHYATILSPQVFAAVDDIEMELKKAERPALELMNIEELPTEKIRGKKLKPELITAFHENLDALLRAAKLAEELEKALPVKVTSQSVDKTKSKWLGLRALSAQTVRKGTNKSSSDRSEVE